MRGILDGSWTEENASCKDRRGYGSDSPFLCGDRSGMGKRAVQPTVRTQERETNPVGPKALRTRENDRGTWGGTGIERGWQGWTEVERDGEGSRDGMGS